MRVTVTPINPSADASAPRLRVSLSVVDPVIAVASAQLNLNPTAIQPSVGVTHVLAAASVAHVLLAVSAGMDDSGRYQYIAEAAVVTDTATISLGKAFYEVVGVADEMTYTVDWNRSFSDNAPIVELVEKAAHLQNPLDAASRYVLIGYVLDGYVAVDSVFMHDALGINLQNYVSGDFFGEAYVGQAFGPY